MTQTVASSEVIDLLRGLIGRVEEMGRRLEVVERNGRERVGDVVAVGGEGSVSTESERAVAEEVFVEEESDVGSWSDRVEAEEKKVAGVGEPVRGADEEEKTDGFVGGVVGSGSGEGADMEEKTAFGSVSSGASVELPVRPRSLPLVFGGVDESVVDAPGGYAAHVRNARVKELRTWLREKAGVVVRKADMRRLALASYAAGAVPVFFRRGREELRVLAAVGDASLTLVSSRVAYRRGLGTEDLQLLRNANTCDDRLRRALCETGLVKGIVAPVGVDLTVSKAGATAFEAVAGVVEFIGGVDAVERFAVAAGLFA